MPQFQGNIIPMYEISNHTIILFSRVGAIFQTTMPQKRGNLTTMNGKWNTTLIQVSIVVGIFKTTMPQYRGNLPRYCGIVDCNIAPTLENCIIDGFDISYIGMMLPWNCSIIFQHVGAILELGCFLETNIAAIFQSEYWKCWIFFPKIQHWIWYHRNTGNKYCRIISAGNQCCLGINIGEK